MIVGQVALWGPPSAIDHCGVSTPLARIIAEPVVVEPPRKAHMGLMVRVPRRPRALHGFAFPKVRNFPLERDYLNPVDPEGKKMPTVTMEYKPLEWKEAWEVAAAATPKDAIQAQPLCVAGRSHVKEANTGEVLQVLSKAVEVYVFRKLGLPEKS